MIRVGDLTLFSPLEGGDLAVFAADRPRTVRITFNAPQRTVLNVIDATTEGEIPDGAEPQFLAIVEGLQDVEFYAQGAFAVQAEADRVWLRTLDGQDFSTVIPDAVTLTRIAERRVRNPEVERLQAMLMANQERRMGALYEEIANEREAIARERASLANHQREGAAGGNSAAPEPAASAGASAPSPAKAGVGAEGTSGDA